MRAIERRHAIRFAHYFAAELRALAPLAQDGLVAVDEEAIVVSPRGRFLVRNVCMAFDRYLHSGGPETYSRAV